MIVKIDHDILTLGSVHVWFEASMKPDDSNTTDNSLNQIETKKDERTSSHSKLALLTDCPNKKIVSICFITITQNDQVSIQ